MTTECAAFASAVLDDLDGAGAFADYLDEQSDARGLLLRRRWRRWQKDPWAAVREEERERERERAATRWGQVKTLFRRLVPSSAGRTAKPTGAAAVDDTFRRYVRRKFAAESPAPKHKGKK